MVSAELSDKLKFPELYETVTTCMLYRLYEPTNPDAPCMNDGKCSKRYPKEYIDQTWTDGNDYPMYQRRDNGDSFHKNNYTFTNRDVIPYNPHLSQNLIVTSTSKSPLLLRQSSIYINIFTKAMIARLSLYNANKAKQSTKCRTT